MGAKFLQDVDPGDVPKGNSSGGFIDSKSRKWYPAEGHATADRNWAKQSIRVHQNARGKTPEGYLWYPAAFKSTANRGPNPSKPNGHDIEGILIHTTEGWSGGGRTFMGGNRRASAHYGIERDGTITRSPFSTRTGLGMLRGSIRGPSESSIPVLPRINPNGP